MKLKEAKELYNKLKPLENKCKMEGGLLIHKFFILPMEYLKKNNISIEWHTLMESDDILELDVIDNRNLDFDIVGIHQASYSVFLPSTNLELFKSFLN